MKISVVTPTIRREGLDLILESLSKQTFKDFEFIVCSPFPVYDERVRWIMERPKHEGDYYSLEKSWNDLFRNSKGELIVTVCDLEYIKPDALERLWARYEEDPCACVSGFGDQFKDVVNGVGVNLVWSDIRPRVYAPSNIVNFDQALCSFPRKAVFAVGGLEEDFDRVAANGEHEFCMRLVKFGYSLWLDPEIQYIAKFHPRINDKWDEMFKKGQDMLKIYEDLIINHNRLKLDYLGDYLDNKK